MVSVNLSKAGLRDLTLPDRAAALCVRCDVSPRHITFELTESTLATDATALLDISSRLRLKGFRLSLDDFGTGYASLEELRSLPFHELKLDKQFVQAAGHDNRVRAILENSIALARDLGMDTVAEGVETPAMVDLVASLGCRVIQGFVLAPPMAGTAVLEWLDRGVTIRPRGAPPKTMDDGALAAETLRTTHDAAGHLMMVLAMSELLLDDPTLSAELRSDLARIHESAREVTVMLKRLQERARLSSRPHETSA
jgi:predicted signal transduction protein with EAL and GGDEF domain